MLREEDVGRLQALFDIVEKVAVIAPGLFNIRNEALDELHLFDKAIGEQKEANSKVEPVPELFDPHKDEIAQPADPIEPVEPKAIPSSAFNLKAISDV